MKLYLPPTTPYTAALKYELLKQLASTIAKLKVRVDALIVVR